jgi:hypothetical protein
VMMNSLFRSIPSFTHVFPLLVKADRVDGSSNADEMSSKKKMSSFEKSNRIEEGGSIDDLQDKDEISYRESEVGSKLNRGMAHIQVMCFECSSHSFFFSFGS